MTAMIVGLGELVLDAHYDFSGDTFKYRYSRGGGSVWNILVNASALGGKCGSVSVAGEDWREKLASEDLASFGVADVDAFRVGDRPTAVMHHLPVQLRGAARGARGYITTTKCPVCLQRPQSVLLRDGAASLHGHFDTDSGPGGLVTDRITDLRVAWAKRLRQAGWLTVLDIGYAGYLRFRTTLQLREALRAFGLIVIQKGVVSFLTGRTGVASPEEVAEVASAVLVVSDGANGLTIYDGRGGGLREAFLEAPAVDVVDTIGAGDRLLGAMIARLGEAGIAGFSQLSFADLHEAAKAAIYEVPAALAEVGARGHLRQPSELAGYGPRSNVPIEELREQSGAGSCVMCGSLADKPSRPPSARPAGQAERRKAEHQGAGCHCRCQRTRRVPGRHK